MATTQSTVNGVPTNKPSRKVTAGAVAGAVAGLLVYFLNQRYFAGVMPDNVQGMMLVVATGVVGPLVSYITPHAPNEGTVTYEVPSAPVTPPVVAGVVRATGNTTTPVGAGVVVDPTGQRSGESPPIS